MSASRQTPTLPGPRAVPGNPNQEAPCWRLFSLQLSYWPLSPPTGWKPAAHTHVCSPVTSKPVALGFLATWRPAVFPPTPRHVRGQSASVPETPRHSETGLGQVCFPQRAASRGGRGPRPAGVLLECLGSSSGVCGVRQDTRRMDGVCYLPASQLARSGRPWESPQQGLLQNRLLLGAAGNTGKVPLAM